jgi:DNA-binding NtrC family response regulator
MADSPRRPPRPSRPGSDRPTAPPLGGALPLGRGSAPDSSEVGPGSKALKTTPLRPLIDIAQPQLTLTVVNDGGQPAPRTLVHEGEVCRIGTHPSNDLTLEDPAVSRFHCRLVLDPEGWRVEDSGSMNGTRLQDLRVYDAALPPEATLSIGNSLVRIHSTEASGKTLVPMMPSFGALTGTGRVMRKLFALLEKVAASDINVFIHGESGTGKELVATEIVQRGARADRPFVVVDCGAISPNLVESELFGHVRGAFTGADRERVGAFEAADGGTVFLDEIGELPLAVQPKLLRALEQREIRRVGETQVRKVDVRVLSATNRDLEREVNKGSFRGDLYFRIAVLSVRVPALRERTEDLPFLIRAFLAAIGASDSEHLFQPLTEELAKHEWPGNVRELRNYVERSVVLRTAKLSIAPPASSLSSTSAEGQRDGVDVGVPFKVAKDALIDQFERSYIRAALDACSGNMTKAARLAGIDRMYLHRLVQKHGSRDQLSSTSSPSEPGSAQHRKPVE